MEDNFSEQFAEQKKLLEELQKSVRKLEFYFRWTLILTVVFMVLPLIGLAFVIPAYLKTLNFSSLGL